MPKDASLTKLFLQNYETANCHIEPSAVVVTISTRWDFTIHGELQLLPIKIHKAAWLHYGFDDFRVTKFPWK